jgi:hypothetical protein
VKPFRLTMPELLERDLHEAVARALDALVLPPAFWFCYPAGLVQLSPQQAARYVRAGLKTGLPDIFVFYGGVYLVELKRHGSGRVSETRIVKTRRGLREIVGQRQRFEELRATGAVIDGAICTSVDGVIDQLTAWGIPMRKIAGAA